jgi:phosphohistidine phosphatase
MHTAWHPRRRHASGCASRRNIGGVRQLLVLRHAKSSWADSSIDDWHRPLNDRGRRDAPHAGEWLRKQSLVPDLIVTSDAVRALSTAQAVAAAAGYARDIVIEPSLYHAGPAAVLAVLNGVREQAAETVMIVGHNPGLEDFVRKLTGEDHDLPTTALVQLAVPIDSWSELDATTVASVVDSWRP